MSAQPDSPDPPAFDARLVPALVSAWAATAFGLIAGTPPALGFAALTAIGGTVAAHRHRFAVAAALLLGCGFAVAIAARTHAVAAHPLAALPPGSRVAVEAVVTDDPKRVRAKPGHTVPAQVTVRAGLRSLQHGGTVVHIDGRVLFTAPVRGWTGLLPGQQIRVYAHTQPPRRHDLTVAVLRAAEPPVRLGRPPWWQRAAGRVRARFSAASAAALPDDIAGLLPALAIGDMSNESDSLQNEFQQAGLSHVTAVSGENLTVFIVAVGLLARQATLGPRTRLAATAAAIAGFVVLARPSASVLRAAAMGGLGVIAMAAGRRTAALPALCAAAIVLFGGWPALALDPGFALSFLATVGLIAIAPGWQRRLIARGCPRLPAEMIAVACAAYVATAPVAVALSGRLNPVSILANLLVHIVIAPITLIGLASAAISLFWLPAGEFLARLAGPSLWWLCHVAAWCG
jgi:competence protein ComEC